MTNYRHFSAYELNQLHRYGLGRLQLPITDLTPVEHLTHHAEFCHRDFYVNKKVLIPRLDSEKIIDLALDYAPKHFSLEQPLKLADVCTGSGCLGITLFLELQKKGFQNLHLTLSDISDSVLKVTQLNTQKYLPNSTYTILKSDLFREYPNNHFGIILSNPPYLPTFRLATLDPSVKDHEPLLALDGGPSGTTIINRLLTKLPIYTEIPSLTLIEIDHQHTLGSFQIPSHFQAQIYLDDQDLSRFLSLAREC